MSQYVQLEQVFIYLVIIKMGGYYVRFYVVGRVLHRAELIDFMVVRDDYYSSRVLAGGPLHAGAVLREPVRLVLVYRYSLLIVEFAHVAIGGLVRYGAYCSSLVNVLLSEYSSHVFVSRGLIFAGEVEVYIRFLVSVKTQERRETVWYSRLCSSVLRTLDTLWEACLFRSRKAPCLPIPDACTPDRYNGDRGDLLR